MMKRLLLIALLVVLPSLVFGQTTRFTSKPDTFTGGTLTSPICEVDGTSAAPPYTFCSDTDMGIYREPTGSGVMRLQSADWNTATQYGLIGILTDGIGLNGHALTDTTTISMHFNSINIDADSDNDGDGWVLLRSNSATRDVYLDTDGVELEGRTDFQNYAGMRLVDETSGGVLYTNTAAAGEVNHFTFDNTGATIKLQAGAAGTPSAAFSNATGLGLFETTSDIYNSEGLAFSRHADGDLDAGMTFKMWGSDYPASESQSFAFIDPNATSQTGGFFTGSSSGGATPTNQITLYPYNATGTSWWVRASSGGISQFFQNNADNTYNIIMLYSTSAATGDGVDVDAYIAFYDNTLATATEYVRLHGPFLGPTGQNNLYLPDESGTIVSLQSGNSTLTDATPTSILSFPLADTEFIAGSVHTVTKCSDASNTVWRHDTSDFICTNQSDTESCSFQTNLGSPLSLNDGAGTFATHTLGVSTGGTNTVTITLDADCSYASITSLESDWEIDFHQPDWALVTEEN